MFNHILVPLDGSSLAECVLPHVVAIARIFNSKVTFLQVLKRPERTTGQLRPITPLNWQLSRAEVHKYLEGITKRMLDVDVHAEFECGDGLVSDCIIEFAHNNAIDLLILSSHGYSGLSGWNISSVALKVVARALLPTMIIRAYESATTDLTSLHYKKVLIPLDTSSRAECALPVATSIARSLQSQLTLVHIINRPKIIKRAPLTEEDIKLVEQFLERNQIEASRYFTQLEAQLSSEDIDVQVQLITHSKPAVALSEVVEKEKPDLVVLNAHGYSGETRWPYGNIVDKFINYCHTPLLIFQDFSPSEIERTKAEKFAKQTKGH